MSTIKQLFHIDSPKEDVFKAISTIKGLQNWWTKTVEGKAEKNETIIFKFGAHWDLKMKVLNCIDNEQVLWECIEGAPDWIGTTLTFNLDRNEGKTRIRFIHDKWKEEGDFYAQCNFTWGRYLVSLRDYCETGKGSPFES